MMKKLKQMSVSVTETIFFLFYKTVADVDNPDMLNKLPTNHKTFEKIFTNRKSYRPGMMLNLVNSVSIKIN